jgi:hypothetical protein
LRPSDVYFFFICYCPRRRKSADADRDVISWRRGHTLHIPTVSTAGILPDLSVLITAIRPAAGPARLHRASKAARRVAVYAYKDAAQLAVRLGGERIHRLDALKFYAMDFEWLSNLAERLQRRTTFTLTVSEQLLYLSLGEEARCQVS